MIFNPLGLDGLGGKSVSVKGCPAMTDQDLLELAAKAGGITDQLIRVGENFYWAHRDYLVGEWNPLADDGDALRLAVKLNLMITVATGTSYADHFHDNEPNVAEAQKSDPYSATRRAIVRAAASIGEALP